MPDPLLPPPDETRLAALLEAGDETALGALVRIATLVCRAQSGALALVQGERVRFASRVHLDDRDLACAGSACAVALESRAPLAVEDLGKDERFSCRDATWAEPPPRFFAAAPVVTSLGEELGVLCVFDPQPRRIEDAQLEALGILARQAAARLELGHTVSALADREARLFAILDTAVEGIITIDQAGLVRSFNRAAERIFGWTACEVVGRNVAMLMPEPDRSRHDAYVERYVHTGEAHIVGMGREVTGQRKDGRAFPLYLAVSEVKPCARGRLFTGIVRDVSDVREADRAKREFVSVVSHELRTPLTSIRGALELIGGGAVGPLSTAAAELLSIARANCDRLVRLVGDILDLGKIQAGRVDLFLQPLEAKDLAEAVFLGVRPLADEAGVLLAFQGEQAPLRGDRDRLVQVLTNLVSNAIKFSPRGEKVLLTVRASGARVRFEVQDRGPGIAAEQQALLFQPFQQLDSSDRRQKGGTGLGLAICKALVLRHQGEVGVVSQAGAGSTFWFEVPADGPARPEEGAA